MADSTRPVTGAENLNIWNLTRKSLTLKITPHNGKNLFKNLQK